MNSLKVLTWVCWGLAAVSILLFLGSSEIFFVSLAVALGVTGVLVSGLHQIVLLLTEIRDKLPEQAVLTVSQEIAEVSSDVPANVRTIEEIQKDLDRMNARLST